VGKKPGIWRGARNNESEGGDQARITQKGGEGGHLFGLKGKNRTWRGGHGPEAGLSKSAGLLQCREGEGGDLHAGCRWNSPRVGGGVFGSSWDELGPLGQAAPTVIAVKEGVSTRGQSKGRGGVSRKGGDTDAVGEPGVIGAGKPEGNTRPGCKKGQHWRE